MELIELTKVCTKCDERKSWDNFYNQKRGLFNVTACCKVCNNNRNEKWIKNNPKKILENRHKRAKNNHKKNLEDSRTYRKKNRKKQLENGRRWYTKNSNKVKEKNSEWRKNNLKKSRKSALEWNKNNSKLINERQRKRRKQDPKYKLNRNTSTAIGTSLRGNKNGRHWEILVGYTLKQLIQHLEKQFTTGMSWENYGKWHLDHKIPLAAHNFINFEHADFKKAWALSNLQPMWAKENMIKHAKLTKHFQPSLLL